MMPETIAIDVFFLRLSNQPISERRNIFLKYVDASTTRLGTQQLFSCCMQFLIHFIELDAIGQINKFLTGYRLMQNFHKNKRSQEPTLYKIEDCDAHY